MASEDIRDLLGRYATGSLTAEEQQRLFDAALDDQELFEELAREDEMKELLAGPGVRTRLIRALDPPRRRVPWVLVLAPIATMSALMMVILLRPAPKPQQVAIATPSPAPASSAPLPPVVNEPQPIKRKALERAPQPAKEEETKAKNAVKKDLDSRAADQKEVALKPADQVAPPPQTKAASQTVEVQAQASQVQVQGFTPGGPKQNAVQAPRAMAIARSRIGFYYSIQTPGHLIVIPLADGYLSVKSASGVVIFAPQRIAAGISTDIVLTGSVRSLTIQFSADANPGPVPSTVRTEPTGTAQGPSAVAIELKINP